MLTKRSADQRNVVAMLRKGLPWQRRQACRWLHGIGPFDDARYSVALCELAVDDPDAQRDVFTALRSVDPATHASLARWFVRDGNASTRVNAVWAVGELGVEGLPLQPLLLEALDDDWLTVSENAAFALSRQDHHAAPALDSLARLALARSQGEIYVAAHEDISRAITEKRRRPPSMRCPRLVDETSIQQWHARLDPHSKVEVAYRLVRSLLPYWERLHLSDRAPRTALNAVRDWLACPCESHRTRAEAAAAYITSPSAGSEAAFITARAASLTASFAAPRHTESAVDEAIGMLTTQQIMSLLGR